MSINKIRNTPEFLLENGLIFEINRKVLHPLGLALEVIIDDENKVSFGQIWDYRTDAEGIIFSEEAFDVGQEKLDKFMNDFGNMRHASRLMRLGFIIQEQPKDIHDTDLNIDVNVGD